MASKIYYGTNRGVENIRVYFTNPLTQERIERNFKEEDKKQALKFANELDYEFYSQNKSFLPDGISIEKQNKRFRLFVRFSKETGKDAPKILFSNKLLSEVIKVRAAIIKTLTGIRN